MFPALQPVLEQPIDLVVGDADARRPSSRRRSGRRRRRRRARTSGSAPAARTTRGSAWCCGGCGRARAGPAAPAAGRSGRRSAGSRRSRRRARPRLVAQRRQHRPPPGSAKSWASSTMTASYFACRPELRREVAHDLRAARPPRSRCPAGRRRARPTARRTRRRCRRTPAGALRGQRRHLALEVLREPDRVAEQRHPLRLAGRRRPRVSSLACCSASTVLPLPGAAADLDPVEQPGDLQERGLLLGEPVGRRPPAPRPPRSRRTTWASGRRGSRRSARRRRGSARGLPWLSRSALSRTRAARSSWSSRSCSAQRGQSGAAKSSAKSEYGVTTPCAQATAPRSPQRGSRST